MKITINEERRGDTWYLTGENLPGLWLWGKDRSALWAQLPQVIDAMTEANRAAPAS